MLNSLGIDSKEKDPQISIIMDYRGSKAKLDNLNLQIGSKIGQYVTATLPLSLLNSLVDDDDVYEIELAKPLFATTDAASEMIRADVARQIYPYRGAGVIVGFIDSGIDWTHPAFYDASGTSTRIISIWDQDYTPTSPPAGFSYGKEYTQSEINGGLIDHTDPAGHGTHVAGIAVGNGMSSIGQTPYIGVAPESEIIMVANNLNNEGQVFNNAKSNEILDGINYIANKAKSLNKPWVVNLSLSMPYGPRNGNSLFERAINEFATNQFYGEGRIVVTSAGNNGVDPRDTDANRTTRKIHTSNNGPASKNFTIDPDPVLADVISMEVYYPATSNYTFRLTSPNLNTYSVDLGDIYVGIDDVTDGFIVIDNATDQNNPIDAGGDNMVSITIADFNPDENNIPEESLPGGIWTIEMVGGSGEWDAYVLPTLRTASAYFFFDSYTNEKLIGEPGNASNVLTVGSVNSKFSWQNEYGTQSPQHTYSIEEISYFSSPGPTRSGLDKPDIYAPGAWIASAFSKDLVVTNSDLRLRQASNDEYIHEVGTSQATPFVTGTVALILEKNIIENGSQNFGFSEVKGWLDASKTGFGLLDVVGAVGPPIVGIYDRIEVNSGPSLIQLGSSYFYSAKFISTYGDTYPTRWDWTINLQHSGGYESIASRTVNTTSKNQNWNTGNLSATIDPSLSWVRDENGYIVGEMVVSTIDNNGDLNTGGKSFSLKYPPLEPIIYSHTENASSVTFSFIGNGATSYTVHYDEELTGSYDGNDAIQGASPINVGSVTTFTLSGLDLANKQYRIAVVANNSFGSSSLSEPVIVGTGTTIPPANEYDVTWTDFYKANQFETTLYSTQTTDYWKSSAASANRIPAYTDGYLEFIVLYSMEYRMVGFSENNYNDGTWQNHWNTIQYNFYLSNTGSISVYESGAFKGSGGNYALGDTIRVERVGGNINYKVNGDIRYTSLCPYSKSLVIDMCFYKAQDILEGVKISVPPAQSVAATSSISSPILNSTEYQEIFANSEPNFRDSTESQLFKTLSLSPNPTQKEITLNLVSQSDAFADVNIISDRTGEAVLRKKWKLQKGDNRRTIQISSLESGYYIVELKLFDKVKKVRVLKI